MKLTIAIPTYNRNRILADNLCMLLPQIMEHAHMEECRVRIYDNCSEISVAETLKPLLDAFPAINCKIIRNPVNVGGNANIMQCFASCETEWIWIIGDDDTPAPDAVATIFRDILRFSQAVFLSYSTVAYPIAATTSWDGLDGFVEGMKSFSNTLFLSTSIYRVSALAASIRIGYQFAYSGAPHLAILLQALGDQSQTCFCSEQIVLQNSPGNPSERWSLVAHALAIGTLFDLPLSASVRTALAAKVLATFPTTEQIVMQLVLMAVKEGNSQTVLFYYNQIQARFYQFDRSWINRAKRVLYRPLLRFPRLGYWLIALAYRVTRKHEISQNLLHDHFARM